MRHYPLLCPGACALLPPQLFGRVEYYRLMSRYESVRIDDGMRMDKRMKSVHRFDIVDAPGIQTLTVPVSKPAGPVCWRDAVVSEHGKWWASMPNALATAYSRTPFFEFYIDRFLPLLSRDVVGMPVTELCARADALVRDILDISFVDAADGAETVDYRRADFVTVLGPLPPYWQLRQAEKGFVPGLSILDLIFNKGPEACLYLAE